MAAAIIVAFVIYLCLMALMVPVILIKGALDRRRERKLMLQREKARAQILSCVEAVRRLEYPELYLPETREIEAEAKARLEHEEKVEAMANLGITWDADESKARLESTIESTKQRAREAYAAEVKSRPGYADDLEAAKKLLSEVRSYWSDTIPYGIV